MINCVTGQNLASDCYDFVVIVSSPTGLEVTVHEGLVGLIVIYLCTIELGLEISPKFRLICSLSSCKYFVG